MLSNPCRYFDESKSMRLQLTHILSNLYITKSLQILVVEYKEAWNLWTYPLINSLYQLSFGILRGLLLILLATLIRTMPETRLIESPLRVLVNFLVDLLCLGPPRKKTRYPYPPPKRNTLPLVHVVLSYFGWPKLLKIMGFMWNMFHYFVTMKVLSKLLTISCNTLELSILKFVIISFEIMLLRVTSISSMFAPISN